MDESSLDPRLRDSGEEKSIVVNNGHQQVYQDHQDHQDHHDHQHPSSSSSSSITTTITNRLAPNQSHDHYQNSPHSKEPQPQQSHSQAPLSTPTSTSTSSSTRIPQAPPSSSGLHNSIPTVSPNPTAAPPDSIEAQYHHATSTPITPSIGGAGGGGPPIAPPVFTPHTPHTPTAVHDGGGDTPGMSGEGATPLDPNDPKRPRACEACRGLKVKCEPDQANPDGPCKRCAKAGRSCVVTQPTRKRQKKTDSRVAELEKKIDALTASLQATRGGGPSPSNGSNDNANANNGNSNINVNTSANPNINANANGQQPRPMDDKNTFIRFPNYDDTPNGWGRGGPQDNHSGYATPVRGSSVAQPTGNAAGQKRKFSDTHTAPDPQNIPASQIAYGAPYSFDPIDKGIITPELAEVLFTRYTKEMTPHLPAVVFPPSMTAATLRKTRPYLFLAIMAIASSEMAQLQRQLANEVTHLIAEKLVINGEKSVELVQALLITVIWYYPPEHFEELKFYQLVHMAAVLAIDIGLGKKRNVTKPRLFPGGWRDGPLRRAVVPDSMSIESRRTWLSCYFLAANVAMALHRPNLIRWTPFMTECMDILESSPDAAPTDRYLCNLVWTHRLAEEVGMQFSMDDPNISINITEPKVQYALRGFERDMAKYNDSISKEDNKPSLMLSFHVLSLYMHEIALHNDRNEDILRPPLPTEGLGEPIPGLSESLTAAHIGALSSCLTAIDGIFETFLSMDVRNIRCLPVFNFVRVAYATVVLIKMYFSANSPDSELGKVIDKDNMKVEEYLDKLLDKFRAVADGDRSRPASKFQLVLAMLRAWFQKQGQGAPPATPRQKTPQNPRGDAATGPKQDNPAPPPPPPPSSGGSQKQQQQQSEYNPANTPLQLLSEIATGNNPSSRTKQNGGAAPPPQQQQRPPSPPPLPPSSTCSITGMPTGYQHQQQHQHHQHQQQPSAFAAPSSCPPQHQQQQQQQAASVYDGGSTEAMTGGGMGQQQLLTPWLSQGWSELDFYDPGQGFEQAMGLTLQGLGAGLAVGIPNDWEAALQAGWSAPAYYQE